MLHGICLFGSKGNDYEVYLDIMDCRTDNSLITVEENFLSVPLPYKEEEIYVRYFISSMSFEKKQ